MMQTRLAVLVSFALGVLLVLLAGETLRPAQAAPAVPTAVPSATSTRTPTLAPSSTPTTAPTALATLTVPVVEVAPGITLGWSGQIACWNCSPFKVRVLPHHYNPTIKDGYSCYTWDDELNYCMSDTASTVRWAGVWGLAAACPIDWPYGTWVVIPGAGAYICMDRGNEIICADGICHVDILGPGGAAWDGIETDATIWVPLKPIKGQ